MSREKHKKNETDYAMLKKLLPFMKPYKKQYIIAVVMGVIGSFLNIFVPKYIQILSDLIQNGLESGIDYDKVWFFCVTGVLIVLGASVFSYIQARMMSCTTLLTVAKIREDVSDKMDRVPIAYYDRERTGDILSRVTNDVEIVSKAISSSLGDMVRSAVMIVGSTIMMLYTNWILAICVFLTTVIGMRFNTILSGKIRKRARGQRKILGQINGGINEVLTGQMVVKAFNCEDEILENFKTENEKLGEATWKSEFLSKIMHPIMDMISNLSYVVVCVVGVLLLEKEMINVGVLAAFIVFVKTFAKPMMTFFQALGTVQPSLAGVERVMSFLELEENLDDGQSTVDQVQGRIEFDHVQFGYVPGQIILKDFSATVEPGMKVAIVGPTGAGKSTIVNLLMRFYELNGGEIRIDGVPIHQMSREELHKVLGMVLQETWCFDGSVQENIVYSTEGISKEKLTETVSDVGLSFMVDAMPKGLDTVINDAAAVSAGQKQLITIARAMLKNAPVLILDEATSSVDTRTEEYIQRSIDRLCEGRTSFVIAHRLSTIQNADIIFFLKDGDIVEMGNHDELLKKRGMYYELYNSQFDEASA